jgi:hypothetical protein
LAIVPFLWVVMTVVREVFAERTNDDARAQTPPPETDAGYNDDVQLSWSGQN